MWILILPWVECLLGVVLLISLLKRWWIFSVLLAIIVVLLNFYGKLFSAGSIGLFLSEGSVKTVKVMTWNINGMVYESKRVEGIAKVIKDEDPDFVLLSEIFAAISNTLHKRLEKDYPYTSYRKVGMHHCAYSKYPLDSIAFIDTGMDDMVKPMHFSMELAGKRVIVYGCHLASNNYSDKREDLHVDSIESKHDVKQYLSNIKAASWERVKQMEAILEDLALSKSDACIVMGDVNDVSGSAPLRKLEAEGFTDAWWKGGFGYGATIHSPLPYRIDHIMFDESLKLISIKKVRANGLSDHDALVGTFSF